MNDSKSTPHQIRMAQDAAKRRRQLHVIAAIAVLSVVLASLYYAYKQRSQYHALTDTSAAELKTLTASVAELQAMVDDMQAKRIAQAEQARQVSYQQVITPAPGQPAPPPQAIPAPVPVPVEVPLTNDWGFVRDESVPLVDDLRNPGAMVLGPRANRFGAAAVGFIGADGNEHAIFPDRAHGIAALIDLISAFEGEKISTYIAGGNGIPNWKSYTGGSKKQADWYLRVFRDQGVNPDIKINPRDVELVHAITNVHAHAEGSRQDVTDWEIDEAYALLELNRQ